jgi:MarR family transcriptional regulator, organic hydroperoxide resistance regulator
MVISILVITPEADNASVIVALHQATHATLRALAARLAHLALTPAEQNALAVLADNRSRAVGELAAATGTQPTTLTSVLDRLERRNLLTRELNPGDRRSFQVTLTPAGRQAAAAVHAAATELERHALAGLTPAQLAGFRAVTCALTEVH